MRGYVERVVARPDQAIAMTTGWSRRSTAWDPQDLDAIMRDENEEPRVAAGTTG
jgi:hypothetical protein